MFEDSIIKKSGQIWKFYLSLFCFALGNVMVFIGWLIFDPGSKLGAVLIIVGLHLLFGALIFASIAIRCPVCGSHWMWDRKPVNRNADESLLGGLMQIAKCPRCGNQGDSETRG